MIRLNHFIFLSDSLKLAWEMDLVTCGKKLCKLWHRQWTNITSCERHVTIIDMWAVGVFRAYSSTGRQQRRDLSIAGRASHSWPNRDRYRHGELDLLPHHHTCLICLEPGSGDLWPPPSYRSLMVWGVGSVAIYIGHRPPLLNMSGAVYWGLVTSPPHLTCPETYGMGSGVSGHCPPFPLTYPELGWGQWGCSGIKIVICRNKQCVVVKIDFI